MSLKSIGEYNEARRNWYSRLKDRWIRSGIACPECGEELLCDTTTMLTSNPPRSPVQCAACEYRGSVLA